MKLVDELQRPIFFSSCHRVLSQEQPYYPGHLTVVTWRSILIAGDHEMLEVDILSHPPWLSMRHPIMF